MARLNRKALLRRAEQAQREAEAAVKRAKASCREAERVLIRSYDALVSTAARLAEARRALCQDRAHRSGN